MKFKLIFLLLASILLSYGAIAAPVIGTVAPISALHGSTVSGSFKVSSNANVSDVTLESTVVSGFTVSFSPVSFSLIKDEEKTITYTVVVASQSAPKEYTLPFKVKSSQGDVSSSLKITVNESKTLTVSSLTLSKSFKTGNITVINTGNVDLSNVDLTLNPAVLKDNDNNQITLTLSEDPIALIRAGESKTISITSAFPSKLNIGNYASSIIAVLSGVSLNCCMHLK